MIYGTRIRMRAVERSDLPMFVGWLNNPEVRQGLAHNPPLSQVEEERWFENMLERPGDEHPMAKADLAKYFDHLKGPTRKELGASPENEHRKAA